MSRRDKNSLFARMMANGGFDDEEGGAESSGSGSTSEKKEKSSKSMKRTPSEERLFQSRRKDRESRSGLRKLKQTERVKREEEVKLAKMKGVKVKAKSQVSVSYDDSLAAKDEQDYNRNDPSTWSKTGGETCSCLYGNPCVDQYICQDWDNRFEVATKNGWKLAKK